MNRPQSNGLVELYDDKLDRNEFFCMDLVGFLFDDKTADFHEKWTQAKNGECVYRDRCKRYERTMSKRNKRPYQLTLFQKERSGL